MSAHEARYSALSLRQTTRIKLAAGPAAVITVESRNPNNSTSWLTLGGSLRLPRDTQVCAPDAATTLTTGAPACPLSAAKNICFAPSGAITVVDGGADCVNSAAATGATLYLQTIDAQNKHKLVLFGLTGLAKLIDRW